MFLCRPSCVPAPRSLLLLGLIPWAVQAQVTELSSTVSTAHGISADGSTVVGTQGSEAVYWRNGVLTLLPSGGYTAPSSQSASADGSTIVGSSEPSSSQRALVWRNGAAPAVLNPLAGDPSSGAYGVSADGSVVVGWTGVAHTNQRAFRWTQATGMVALPSLGGTVTGAIDVSGDGTVVVGTGTLANGRSNAFRWTVGDVTNTSLGTLAGHMESYATAVSADGLVVVGNSALNSATPEAFRWQGGAMSGLGTLGGTSSRASDTSADGSVVVGQAETAAGVNRGFRWTQAGGMLSVEDWLRASGVKVAADTTSDATGVSRDGSVVVGQLHNGRAYIARVNSGLITLDELQGSLGAASAANNLALRSTHLFVYSTHGDPLMRRVPAWRSVFWVAGDAGRDDHGTRNGPLGLAEIGYGENLGSWQINVALGQTVARQDPESGNRAKIVGTYLYAEGLTQLARQRSGKDQLWATLGAYTHHGQTDLRRGYMNADVFSESTANPDINTWGLRARLDWTQAFQSARTSFSPYVDALYSSSRLDSYTETGGGFPARFDARREEATELHLGVNASRPLPEGMKLVSGLSAVHRFEKQATRSSGEVLGLSGFNFAGPTYKQDWLRARVGLEGPLSGGTASLTINATTQSEAASTWLAANWLKVF